MSKRSKIRINLDHHGKAVDKYKDNRDSNCKDYYSHLVRILMIITMTAKTTIMTTMMKIITITVTW